MRVSVQQLWATEHEVVVPDEVANLWNSPVEADREQFKDYVVAHIPKDTR